MKTLITLMLLSTIAIGQNDSIPDAKKYDRFLISVNTEPNAWVKDGFNFGADIEHYNKNIYTGAGIYVFPDLNGYDYFQFHFMFGLSLTNEKETLRAYTGAIAGATIREGGPFTLFGVESGIEHYFTKHFGIGLEASILNRESLTGFYGGKDWIFNGGIRLIYRFK